ncbi:MAG: pentapeptide repeat-containing protein [Clostridia bacterium]|nr:pentapeptide repeat-containing protein [Clostridia bacterium]
MDKMTTTISPKRKSRLMRLLDNGDQKQFSMGAKIASVVAGIVLIAGLLFTIICSSLESVPAIGSSIVRDINILLISTNATLIGLYVTAFIFLNDSLKTRVKEDPTITEAVQIILHDYRRNMFVISLGTIVTILLEIINNILLGGPDVTDIDNLFITVADWRWLFFVLVTVCSIFVTVWIISSSSDITNSDGLIATQSKKNLREHEKAILEDLEKIVNDENDLPKHYFTQLRDKYYEYKKNCETDEDVFARFTGKDILDCFSDGSEIQNGESVEDSSRGYSFALAYHKVKKTSAKRDVQKCVSEYTASATEFEKKFPSSDSILFIGKNARFIEAMVAKICDNNIDKSIMNADFIHQSMESGFKWLYAREQYEKNDPTTAVVIDVRDANRFLDHIKYRIIADVLFEELPFRNETVEKLFERVSIYFNSTDTADMQYAPNDFDNNEVIELLKEKKWRIANYKKNMQAVVTRFFEGYRHVMGYRDAMVHFSQYTKKDKKRKREEVISALNARKVNIYTEILKRVLIDRFTSFVKTDDLNLGNSTLDKGWFNYSELTNSNFTHSTFRFARLENAIMRKCDLSTCSFINADASGTDFKDSNFSYSNLTGMDLSETILDNAQMNSVLLRDSHMDNYAGMYTLINNIDTVNRDYCYKLTSDLVNRYSWLHQNPNVNLDNSFDLFHGIMLDLVRDHEDMGVKIAETDEDVSLKNENGEFVLSKAHKEISQRIDKFLTYHKYHKISKEIFESLPEARAVEAKKDTKSNFDASISFSEKSRRENLYGKISFNVATLQSASANNVTMKNTDFSYVNMDSASFFDSELSNAEMYHTSAKGSLFMETNLNDLDAYRSDFSNSNFTEANVINANLVDCTATGCNFNRALLINTRIVSTLDDLPEQYSPLFMERFTQSVGNAESEIYNFVDCVTNEELVINEKGKYIDKTTGAPTSDVTRATKRHVVDLERKGQEDRRTYTDCTFTDIIANNLFALNTNFNRSNFKKASLKNCFIYNSLMRWSEFEDADFNNGLVYGVSFYQSNFTKASFSRSKIYGCEFSNVNLSSTRMISAGIYKTIFEESNFDGCNFASADLHNCSFRKCNFNRINLSSCTFKNCYFCEVDFSGAIGLDEANFINCVFYRKNENADPNSDSMILNKTSANKNVLVYLDNQDAPTGDIFDMSFDSGDAQNTVDKLNRYSSQRKIN